MGRKILKDGSGSHRFAISFAHHSHSPTCLSSALPTGGAAGQKLLNQDRSGSSDILQHLSIPPPSRNYEENHKEEGGKKIHLQKKEKQTKTKSFLPQLLHPTPQDGIPIDPDGFPLPLPLASSDPAAVRFEYQTKLLLNNDGDPAGSIRIAGIFSPPITKKNRQ